MSVPDKLAAVRRPLLFLIFGLASLGQLGRIELTPSRAVYLHEIALVVFAAIAAFSLKLSWKEIPLSWKLFTGWAALSLISLWIKGPMPLSSALYLIRFILYLAFGFMLVQLVKQKRLHSSFIEKTLIASITAVAILGWLQYLLLPDTRLLMYLGWDDHYLRLISTLFDPGFTGAVLCLGSLVTLHKLLSQQIFKGARAALLQWSALLTTSALLLTYSRASFVAWITGVSLLWLRSRRPGYLAAGTLFLLAVLILPRGRSEGVLLERTASISARVESVTASKPSNLWDFFVGHGWYSGKSDEIRSVGGNMVPSHNSGPDNSFVFVFSSLGIIGLLVYLGMLKSFAEFGRWSPVTIAVLGAMSAHALFSNTLFYPFVLFYLMGLVAVESGN